MTRRLLLRRLLTYARDRTGALGPMGVGLGVAKGRARAVAGEVVPPGPSGPFSLYSNFPEGGDDESPTTVRMHPTLLEGDALVSQLRVLHRSSSRGSRHALYAGGSLVDGPAGASLLWQSGNTLASTWVTFNYDPVLEVPAGVLWFGTKNNEIGAWNTLRRTSAQPEEDSFEHYWTPTGIDSSEAASWPGTVPGSGSQGSFRFTFQVFGEYA